MHSTFSSFGSRSSTSGQRRGTGLEKSALSEPVETAECTVTVGASIGILTVPLTTVGAVTAEELVEDLLRTADAAMYQAKREGGGIRIVEYALTA